MNNKIYDINWELFSDFYYDENYEPINLYYFKLYININIKNVKLNSDKIYNNLGLKIIEEKMNNYLQYEIISRYFSNFFDCALVTLESKVILSDIIETLIQKNNIIISLN